MTAAEFPELELAFGRALRLAEREGTTAALSDLVREMHNVAHGVMKRAGWMDREEAVTREELPESDPEGNDKVKDERPNFKCSREAHP